ncbi:helix-turn-helix domain-containing protein [Pseudomonas citronellolis]|uniref:helix-turn-helix domain-containing protein n=1 Tax=Pseudomonas citronellolis TaxID=53408 RepID=UPI0009EF341B|nr:XRE family transcriptional regulator [Pseudomonas citronellolis]
MTEGKKTIEVQAFNSVFDAIADTTAEVEKLRLRATLLQAIQKEAASWDGTDRSRAKRLGIAAPRYTLLKRGQLGEFSLDALVVLAVHAGLSIGLTIEHQTA